MESKSILVVEDDESIAEFLRMFLEDLDQQVHIARNGQEGLDQARGCQPDLILLDLTLPVLNGRELARLLKRDPRTDSIPLIALSAADRIPGDLAGDGCLDGFVAKPFEVTELEDTVRVFLART